ncbi:MAG: SDR family oxidoreductase [Pollutimonas bauzanensis]|uniref:3-oxoacyl-[acyl-carrier protein] reductase n=1 Tax=Pollutimonas bauzanensis TaxID=658167 RepID=A0A1M5M2P5_9BURK|nr:SDR family oxidoreductase [Pollutimonas bauzanensis]SHG71189.1 3-oxoacyl-[acyl-carrier protein] reductase [Pollutimonas bauzanensis]
MDFKNKVVLVTGASRGIGAAIAQAFAREGALVAVNYLSNADAAAQVVARCAELGGDAWALRADVMQAAAVDGMVAQVLQEAGRIDVVVNNALRPYRFDPDQRRRFQELDWPAYREQFDGAVQSACNVCRAVLPHMRQRASGSIVNIASDLAEHPIVPYHDYATAKAALVGFSRHLAAEMGPSGIRVNCVAPGLVWPTDASRGTRESLRQQLAAQTPLRRIATPEDVTGPVLFLASDWSGFMTGQVLYVDGGLVMR